MPALHTGHSCRSGRVSSHWKENMKCFQVQRGSLSSTLAARLMNTYLMKTGPTGWGGKKDKKRSNYRKEPQAPGNRRPPQQSSQVRPATLLHFPHVLQLLVSIPEVQRYSTHLSLFLLPMSVPLRVSPHTPSLNPSASCLLISQVNRSPLVLSSIPAPIISINPNYSFLPYVKFNKTPISTVL